MRLLYGDPPYPPYPPTIRQLSAILSAKKVVYATIALLTDGSDCQEESDMVTLSESALRRLIRGGETATVELKVAAPRPVEMAERLCGLANAQGGVVIVGVEDSERKIVGVPDDRMAMTIDTILRAARQNIKPALVLDPPEPEVYVLDGKQVVVAPCRRVGGRSISQVGFVG
jgi:hypothetical protein